MKKAQGLRILVRVVPKKTTTAGGLHIPDGIETKKLTYGEVISVGPLVNEDGCPDVVKGTFVGFDRYSLAELGKNKDGVMYGMIRSTDVFFVDPDFEEGEVTETADPVTVTGPSLLTDAKRPAKSGKQWTDRNRG